MGKVRIRDSIKKDDGEFFQLKNNIAFDNKLSPRAARVLLVLMAHSSKESECYPSIKTIMDKTGLSKDTVRKAIQDLEERGYIEIDPRVGKGGKYNYYFIFNPFGVD